MLNFRKLLHEFSPAVVREGKSIFEASQVKNAQLGNFDTKTLKLVFEVEGAFTHLYKGGLEVSLNGSEITYSDCSCLKKYDCEHIAASCFFLEANIDQILADYAAHQLPADNLLTKNIKKNSKVKEVEKEVEKVLKQAQQNAAKKANHAIEQESLEEYRLAQKVLIDSPFFYDTQSLAQDSAEIMIIFNLDDTRQKEGWIDLSMSVRIDSRSKPIQVVSIREFLEAVNYGEPQVLASKRHLIKWQSFDPFQQSILKLLYGQVIEKEESGCRDRSLKFAKINHEVVGDILHLARDHALSQQTLIQKNEESAQLIEFSLEPFFWQNFEQPITSFIQHAYFEVDFQCLELNEIKVMMEPFLQLAQGKVNLNQACLLCSRKPGLLYQHHYFDFEPHIQRIHLKKVRQLQDLIIPRPMLGTLLEIGLPALKQVCRQVHTKKLQKCTTLPLIESAKLKCELIYVNNKLEAQAYFDYQHTQIPCHTQQLSSHHINSFIQDDVILARDIWHEKQLLTQLFSDFTFDESSSLFIARSEKAIVDFMTQIVPAWRERVDFIYSSTLLDQFIYDNTSIEVLILPAEGFHHYDLKLDIKGPLQNVSLNQIWDCVSSEKPYIELHQKSGKNTSKAKFLVLNLEPLKSVARFMDDLAIEKLTSGITHKPLWTLAHLDEEYLSSLPFKVSIDATLKSIQQQLWGQFHFEPTGVPKEVTVSLRGYQIEGLDWLEKLRRMHLAGVLADDMGLGKTLQAIVAISQFVKEQPKLCSLVVCPTSLLYNWQEEVARFNPKLKCQVIDGTPQNRKKAIESLEGFHLVITSYSLLQKDIDHYKAHALGYVILDEAQHIKNRQTQNAKSVRHLRALHRLAMTGTPVENALEELWSLFDFLMPGFMSSYERFVEKFIKRSFKEKTPASQPLTVLKRKIGPFVLRRMKSEVLKDLPAVQDIVYHCQLSAKQKQLYVDYAQNARKELSAMVAKEGFDKVRIHVLATLTRLKQICCHPAIFAEDLMDQAESAKYDLFWQLIENLVMGGHKAVVFSQYTKMLNLMRRDLEQRGIRYCYLDGSTKARMETVKKFNESADIPIFLVSLKAGGTGLNLTGADSVIHYDLWWNPAVEDQATDRVHRMGQTRSVSAYKLITVGTIEEKIVEMQNRKKGLVRQLVVDDEDAMEKLTWEEVLELLQT